MQHENKAEKKSQRNLTVLPDIHQVIICSFLPLHTQLFWLLTCRHLSKLLQSKLFANLCREALKKNFSAYFCQDELTKYEDQDLKTLLGILTLYQQFAVGIHSHKTPYYALLIEQAIQAFLARKKQSIENFPWAALLMGHLMRVWDKNEAVTFFEMAINAKPSLELAKVGLAITYSFHELNELKKIQLLEKYDTGASLYIAAIRDDFIFTSGKSIKNYCPNPSIHYLYRNTNASFEFLNSNYQYFLILALYPSFFTEKIITKTKEELVTEWLTQMRETKDLVVASHMAAALVHLFFYKQPHLEKRDEGIEECISKGGFDFFLENYYNRDRYKEKLRSIVEEKTPVRPGWLGACCLELGNLEGADKHHDKQMDLYFQAIKNGFPEALRVFNAYVHFHWPEDISLTDKFSSKMFLFQWVFALQQSILWYANLRTAPLDVFKNYQNLSIQKLKSYTESSNTEVQATTYAALGLMAVEAGKYEIAKEYFREAGKNLTIFQEYVDFAKQQGYLLLFEDRQFLQKFLTPNNSLPVADNKEHLLVRRTTPTPSSTTPALQRLRFKDNLLYSSI